MQNHYIKSISHTLSPVRYSVIFNGFGKTNYVQCIGAHALIIINSTLRNIS